MMPAKETKDVCYRLFTENILSLTEIPRTPDHAPSRTLYLFHLHFDNLVRYVALCGFVVHYIKEGSTRPSSIQSNVGSVSAA